MVLPNYPTSRPHHTPYLILGWCCAHHLALRWGLFHWPSVNVLLNSKNKWNSMLCPGNIITLGGKVSQWICLLLYHSSGTSHFGLKLSKVWELWLLQTNTCPAPCLRHFAGSDALKSGAESPAVGHLSIPQLLLGGTWVISPWSLQKCVLISFIVYICVSLYLLSYRSFITSWCDSIPVET